MVVRFKLPGAQYAPAVRRQTAELTELFAFLLTPASVLAFVLAAWRLAADLGWAGQFAIGKGMFSHWMVWFAIGALIQFCAISFRSRSVPVPNWIRQSWR